MVDPAPLLSTPLAAAASPRRPWRGWLIRGVTVLAACTGIALFFTMLDGGRFAVKFVYSACIGLFCWAGVDGLRALFARWRRQRDPADGAAARGWPGWGWMSLCLAIGTVLGYAAGSALGDWLTGSTSAQPSDGNWRGYALVLTVSLAVGVAVSFVMYSRGQVAAVQARAEAAQRVAAETQLKLLQAQLEPHMLFNTLANLRVLIGMDPRRAQTMLDHLIAFLRATLSASRGTVHPLAAEFERTADYLALMKVRMGERLTVTLELPPDLAAQPVPTLLLQPLVENAIKHGLEPCCELAEIAVSAARDGQALALTVRDSGVGLNGAATPSGSGFGLAQVRERLAALYGTAASIELAAASPQGTVARVRLPITPSA